VLLEFVSEQPMCIFHTGPNRETAMNLTAVSLRERLIVVTAPTASTIDLRLC
jgi:hypothetical protein